MKVFSYIFIVEGQEFLVTASAGIAVYPKDGEIIGLEALLRWEHPLRGMVSPSLDMSVLAEGVERRIS